MLFYSTLSVFKLTVDNIILFPEHRSAESAKIRAKYPERIPVIVQRAAKSQIPDIDKRKFLVPADLTVAQFMWIIRKRVQLPPEKAIFLFVGRLLPQSRYGA